MSFERSKPCAVAQFATAVAPPRRMVTSSESMRTCCSTSTPAVVRRRRRPRPRAARTAGLRPRVRVAAASSRRPARPSVGSAGSGTIEPKVWGARRTRSSSRSARRRRGTTTSVVVRSRSTAPLAATRLPQAKTGPASATTSAAVTTARTGSRRVIRIVVSPSGRGRLPGFDGRDPGTVPTAAETPRAAPQRSASVGWVLHAVGTLTPGARASDAGPRRPRADDGPGRRPPRRCRR